MKTMLLFWDDYFQIKTFSFSSLKDKKSFLRGALSVTSGRRCPHIITNETILGDWKLIEDDESLLKKFKSLRSLLKFCLREERERDICVLDSEEKVAYLLKKKI